MTKFRKSDLRLTLQKNMHQPVSEKEFSRWFGIYCEMTRQPDDVLNAKELSAEQTDAFAKWLGYPLR